MTTANESKLGGARGGHRGPIVLRVAAARVLPLLPVAARGARLVLSMGLAAGCVRARSSSSPLRGGHCPPSAASTAIGRLHALSAAERGEARLCLRSVEPTPASAKVTPLRRLSLVRLCVCALCVAAGLSILRPIGNLARPKADLE